jgi:hypothetical protein
MKNKLIDLNNHLFAQIERLSDEETKGDSLKEEIDRSRAISGVARHIIENARLALDAEKEIGKANILSRPAMIGVASGEE